MSKTNEPGYEMPPDTAAITIHRLGDTFVFWDDLPRRTFIPGALFQSKDLPLRIEPSGGTVLHFESMTGTARYAIVDYDSLHDRYELSFLSWVDKSAG